MNETSQNHRETEPQNHRTTAAGFMFSPNSFFTTNCWETLFNLAQHKWSEQVLCQQFSYSSWSNIKLLMFWMESGAGHVLGTNIILTDFSWEEWMCQWNQRWCWQVERVNCLCVCDWPGEEGVGDPRQGLSGGAEPGNRQTLNTLTLLLLLLISINMFQFGSFLQTLLWMFQRWG